MLEDVAALNLADCHGKAQYLLVDMIYVVNQCCFMLVRTFISNLLVLCSNRICLGLYAGPLCCFLVDCGNLIVAQELLH